MATVAVHGEWLLYYWSALAGAGLGTCRSVSLCSCVALLAVRLKRGCFRSGRGYGFAASLFVLEVGGISCTPLFRSFQLFPARRAERLDEHAVMGLQLSA
eukprot:1820933-Pyramimonas_sp.AAC.1